MSNIFLIPTILRTIISLLHTQSFFVVRFLISNDKIIYHEESIIAISRKNIAKEFKLNHANFRNRKLQAKS